MSVHVAALANYGKAKIVGRLEKTAGIDLSVADDNAALARIVRTAEVLVVPAPNYVPEVAAAVAEAPNLKWIQTSTAGFDPLQRHGVPKGITVTNAGDAWSPAVAELAIALLFALVKKVPDILGNIPTQSWQRSFSSRMGGFDGMRLAILGYGSIGRAVAERVRPFGMQVCGLKRTPAPDGIAHEVRPIGDLHEVLARSDAVLVASPLTAETRGLLGRDAFGKINRGAFVINISRGGVIDSHALAEALTSGQVGGAGLDVTDPEPLPPGHPLWSAPNIIISPHVAGSCGPRGEERVAETIGDNVARYVAGEPLRHVVEL